MDHYVEKERSGCALAGIMNERGTRFSGEAIIKSISVMRERSNGLGGGFAAYGIYPKYKEFYAFHLLYSNEKPKEKTEEYLDRNYLIQKDEPIPFRKVESIKQAPCLWRYFLKVKNEKFNEHFNEEDFVVKTVMEINTGIDGAFIFSSGKNMGIFKGVGFPEDIGTFYRLEDYEGYTWIAHGRFPTNSVAWWGGAHPFGLLDWSVVHNGEISSYGINRRFLLNHGYHCTLFTDTEVMAYLFDLLGRRHRLDFAVIAKILAAPFWDEVDRLEGDEYELAKALRITYSSALVNGPFSIIVGHSKGMVGLNDRLKLRPLIAGRKGDMLYISSEECGIREVCNSPDRIWAPKAGEPVIGRLID
ncbi:MAG: glutamine amidotransferase family protein [Candidatus Bathyarchaeia archaeon]|nr:glutamine amidotransferase family protein [Candidatus Bathyarchaeota archaeon]